jgi:hypothetical protein
MKRPLPKYSILRFSQGNYFVKIYSASSKGKNEWRR